MSGIFFGRLGAWTKCWDFSQNWHGSSKIERLKYAQGAKKKRTKTAFKTDYHLSTPRFFRGSFHFFHQKKASRGGLLERHLRLADDAHLHQICQIERQLWSPHPAGSFQGAPQLDMHKPIRIHGSMDYLPTWFRWKWPHEPWEMAW